MRLLLEPAAAPEGGAATVPPPAATTPPAGAPAASPPPPPAPVPLPADEVARLYGIARQFESLKVEQQAKDDAAAHKATIALAQKGEVEKAFGDYKATQDAKVATLQTTILNRESALTIAAALANVPFTSADAARDARELLGLRVEAVLGSDGNPVVRDRATGRPAADTIKEWLASPAAGHFLKPTTQGGAGATGGHVPAPSPEAAPKPRNLGEYLAAQALQATEGRQKANPFQLN